MPERPIRIGDIARADEWGNVSRNPEATSRQSPQIVLYAGLDFDQAQSGEIGSIVMRVIAERRGASLAPDQEHAMRLLSWKDEYNIGAAAIDDERRHLIATINRLHEELDRTDARQTVVSFFEDLKKEIAAHFSREEAFMREHGCDELGRHKADHDRLLEELDDIGEAYAFSAEVDSVELGIRLEEWFFRHFRTFDARLHQMLGEH